MELAFTPAGPEPEADRPDIEDSECRCENADNQYVMEIDCGSVYFTHATCGKPPGSWSDESFFMPKTPVTMTWNSTTDYWSGEVDAYGDIAINGLHTPRSIEAERAKAEAELRARVYALAHRQPSAQKCTVCGHTGIVHRLPQPRTCMADNDACSCPDWTPPCSYPNGPCVCPGTEGIAPGASTAEEGRPERVVICGSTRYTAEMAAIEQLLIWRGVAVFAPTACDLNSPNPLWDDPAERDAGAKRLADLHAAMIRDAHWVLVVGPYAGDSTRGEIAHAQALGKTVRFTAPVLAAEFDCEVWDPAGVGQATA